MLLLVQRCYVACSPAGRPGWIHCRPTHLLDLLISGKEPDQDLLTQHHWGEQNCSLVPNVSSGVYGKSVCMCVYIINFLKILVHKYWMHFLCLSLMSKAFSPHFANSYLPPIQSSLQSTTLVGIFSSFYGRMPCSPMPLNCQGSRRFSEDGARTSLWQQTPRQFTITCSRAPMKASAKWSTISHFCDSMALSEFYPAWWSINYSLSTEALFHIGQMSNGVENSISAENNDLCESKGRIQIQWKGIFSFIKCDVLAATNSEFKGSTRAY